MPERFPRLNLNSVNHRTIFSFRKFSALFYPSTRVRASFLERWGLRRAHVVMASVRPFDLEPRTLLPIFCADPRGVQHTRGGLGDAFGADACAVVIAGWGKICASGQMRGQPGVDYRGLACADLSFLCCSRTDCFARL